MGATIGIDLGTTNSCMAIMSAESPAVIPSTEGGRTVPSVVAFTPSGERLVGVLARRQAVTNPGNTVFSVKRFMGRSVGEVDAQMTAVPYETVAGAHGDVRINAGGATYSAPEIAAMILAKLKADAEAYLGETVDAAVITVPAYFNDAQRQATKDAGTIAGLDVKRIINEPTAAALAYGLDHNAEGSLLVFDLGGGTFDVSVLEISDGVFDVRATAGDNRLGGDDFDQLLVAWMVGAFRQSHGIDLSEDPMALQRLYEAAEKAKIELSSTLQTQASLPFITADASGPKHLDLTLTRTELERITGELLERIEAPLRQAMRDAQIPRVDRVILVGGMTRMPAVIERVAQITGVDPQRGVNPDEVVALGAAVQAAVLAGQMNDVLLLDVTPLSLGVETGDGMTGVVIPRNTTIPTTHTETFTTSEHNQDQVQIHIVQGERAQAADNRSLGQFLLTGIGPAAVGVPQIAVTFVIDADGIVRVSARDEQTGYAQSVEVHASSGLTDEEITRMVAVAAEAARADQALRLRASARHRGERALAAAARRGEPDAVLADAIATLTQSIAGDDPTAIDQATERVLDLLDAAMRAEREGDDGDAPASGAADLPG